MTLLVTGRGRLGCAIDTVRDDVSADVAGYLAVRDQLMAELGDTAAVAGARVLAALRATGDDSPDLIVDRVHPDGWVRLRTGDAVVATWVTNINDRPDAVVFAVLSGEERCHG
jgi:enediyne polyketide synthase